MICQQKAVVKQAKTHKLLTNAMLTTDFIRF